MMVSVLCNDKALDGNSSMLDKKIVNLLGYDKVRI